MKNINVKLMNAHFLTACKIENEDTLEMFAIFIQEFLIYVLFELILISKDVYIFLTHIFVKFEAKFNQM